MSAPSYWMPRAIALSSGFLSLSQELAWVRYVSFLQKGTPYAFSIVLAVYLVGIAVGAWFGKRFCDRPAQSLAAICGSILLVSGLFDFAAPWLTISAFAFGKPAGYATAALMIALSSAFKSAVFPIVHHMGSQGQNNRLGRSVSTVYFANIIGSTAGPLVTGLFLFDVFTLQQLFFAIGFASMAVGASVHWAEGARRTGFALGASTALSLLLFLMPAHSLVRSLIDLTKDSGAAPTMIVENSHGITHLLDDPAGKHYVLGGNVYDGRVNTDPFDDVNGIWRAYILAALHPAPQRILNVGLSAGPWTKVLSAIEGVQRIDVVEIDPGYVQLAATLPAVSSILSDQRIHIHFDDGRRWLKRNPDEKFDIIVINTTFHWRAYSTLLLSREFLEIAKQHLRPGGIIAWNSTVSGDVFKTAAAVFPHVAKVQAFVVAGMGPIEFDPASARTRLAAMHWADKRIFTEGDPRFDAWINKRHHDLVAFRDDLAWERRPLQVITDQNMITEFRFGSIRVRKDSASQR